MSVRISPEDPATIQLSIQWVSGGVLRCCFSKKLLDNVDTAGPFTTMEVEPLEAPSDNMYHMAMHCDGL